MSQGKNYKRHHLNPLLINQTTMKKLYADRGETGDVSFIVESEVIRAHRCVLATHSPKYKAQFYGVQPDQGEIRVDGVSADAFREFLQFFYLDEVFLTQKNIEDVLNLACQSLVNTFVNVCEEFLKYSSVLLIDNFCWSYRLAMLYDLKSLQNKCRHFFNYKTYALKVLANAGFENCDRELLPELLQLYAEKCKEIDYFNACIAWAKTACKLENKDPENGVNLRAVLGDAITNIRFGNMTIEEFAEIHSKYDGLFSTDESIEIMYMIGKVNGFKSKRFNQLSRKEFEFTVKKVDTIFECDRVSSKSEDRKGLRREEKIWFYCIKLIKLHGLVIATTNIGDIKILVACSIEHFEYCPKFTTKSKTDTNETIITFDQPIFCTNSCFIHLERDSWWNNKDGYYVKDTIESHGTHFIFNRVDPDGSVSFVKRILYSCRE
ncbi:uncharacterized protein LOC116348516 [Contarinia nasturtii]|uniref:uncharacterized protein LOC116348516 n=1 Tax=Contarinia nasturtii TaxID=265458 RepID=UPI0012D3BCF9|nr:uncharacterized protein LOC116348516 [Contarinia nasturtii]